MKRFWGTALPSGEMKIEGSEFNHLKNVLRLKVGDSVIVSIGDEYDYICEIVLFNKNDTILHVLEKHICAALPTKQIDLFIAMPKREYFETILTKAVELGTSNVIPFVSRFSVNHTFKPERAAQIVATACKQSEQSRPLSIQPIIDFNQMLGMLTVYDMVIFANEHESQLLEMDILSTLATKQKIAVIVGCEGGFDQSEAAAICETGATSISLGKRILRCDTAAISMLALVGFLSKN